MNFFESIESIKVKLRNADKVNFAEEILELQLSGGTGGILWREGTCFINSIVSYSIKGINELKKRADELLTQIPR